MGREDHGVENTEEKGGDRWKRSYKCSVSEQNDTPASVDNNVTMRNLIFLKNVKIKIFKSIRIIKITKTTIKITKSNQLAG